MGNIPIAEGKHGKHSQGHPNIMSPSSSPTGPDSRLCRVTANSYGPQQNHQRGKSGWDLLSYETRSLPHFLKSPDLQPLDSLPCHFLQGLQEVDESSEAPLQLGT